MGLSVRAEGAEGLAAMSKTVSEKMGLKAGTRAIFVNAPEHALVAIDPPTLDVASELAGGVRLHPPLREDPEGARRRAPEAEGPPRAQGHALGLVAEGQAAGD